VLELAFFHFRGRRDRQYPVHVRGYSHPIAIRGGKSSDVFALYEILVLDEYAFVGDLKAPATIIDGGANVGIASVYFLKRYPTARVLAVEPDPGNLDLCRKNLAPYKGRAEVIRGAIWSSTCPLDLDYSRQEDWTIRVRAQDPDGGGPIGGLTMESLIAMCGGKVDLLKLDIEGSEAEVFGPSARQWLPNVRL
jgi:FkbM family methyltransferase